MVNYLHSYFFMKIKEGSRTTIVDFSFLKEVIGRNKGAIPKALTRYIIKDLVSLKLLIPLNKYTYQIVESDCDRKIKNLLMVP
jgi:hypothetical protein